MYKAECTTLYATIVLKLFTADFIQQQGHSSITNVYLWLLNLNLLQSSPKHAISTLPLQIQITNVPMLLSFFH